MTSLPNYEIIKVIGSGCFGYVFEAYDKTNKKKVALKRIEKVGTQLSREYEILFKIKDCENVVKILVRVQLFRTSSTPRQRMGS